MRSSTLAIETAVAADVRVTHDALIVDLRDGRRVSVPLGWYPRLEEGRPAERRNWQLIGAGIGIHWPDLDEDICIDDLLLGRASNEGSGSLQRWRDSRNRQSRVRPSVTSRGAKPKENRGSR